jgi:hypothetical protein
MSLKIDKEETVNFVKIKVSVKNENNENKVMSYEQVKEIYKKMLEQKNYDKNDISIMGLSKNGIFKLKGMNENIDNIENNEYWQNKNVVAQNLLDKFYCVEFMILK